MKTWYEEYVGLMALYSNVINFIVKYLAELPHIYNEVYKACEVMRLAPPVQGTFMFAGFSILKGWKLHWNVYFTHKNGEYFPQPKRFDPTRFEGNGPPPYTFVPFGRGPRMCPGCEYARLEILVFIHNVVKRFRWQKLNPKEKITLCPAPTPVSKTSSSVLSPLGVAGCG